MYDTFDGRQLLIFAFNDGIRNVFNNVCGKQITVNQCKSVDDRGF